MCDGQADCFDGEDEKNCPMKEPCGTGSFRCRSDHVCLPMSKYCDKVIHCSDASDEEDCDKKSKEKTHIEDEQVKCGDAYFACDDICRPLMMRCDGKPDCYDESDEDQCGKGIFKRVYQVTSLSLAEKSLNETSFMISWWLPSKTNIEYLPSIAPISTGVWKNHTEWLKNLTHRFTNLRPYTKYNVTVYAREKNENPAPPYVYINVTTSEGMPSEPLNVNVTQLNGSRVQVSWDPPKETNGELMVYTVYYRPQAMSGGSAQSVRVNAPDHSIILESYFKGNVTYVFWVRARNSRHESSPSKMVHFTFDDVSNIDFLQQLTVTDVKNNTITLKWQEVKSAEGYIIQPVLPQPYPKIKPLKTNKTEIEIKNMVADVLYTFKVSAYVKSYIGRPQSVKITLKGDPLPAVPNVRLFHESESVSLAWDEPNTNLKNLTYGVYYGTSLDELFEKSRIITQEHSINLTDYLMPCESYLISVGIVGPIGPGPLGRTPVSLDTSFNDKKPPKNLQAVIDSKKRILTIKWQHNCLIANTYPSYVITLHEKVLNKTKKLNYVKH